MHIYIPGVPAAERLEAFLGERFLNMDLKAIEAELKVFNMNAMICVNLFLPLVVTVCITSVQ